MLPLVADNTVTLNIGAGSSYEDASPLPDDPAVPIEAQTLSLVNCLDAAGTYLASIYEGTKDTNSNENLATGVTGVRIKNVIGTGTIALTVDGTNLLPVFDTTVHSVYHWPTTGTNVSWVMTGVTQFDLGQGRI